MDLGDIVVRKSYGKDITFRIMEVRSVEEQEVYIIEGINIRIVADSPVADLELAKEGKIGELDKVFDRKVNSTIKKVLTDRVDIKAKHRSPLQGKGSPFQAKESPLPVKAKDIKNKELFFGRPGKVLHIDADENYMNSCLKVYKQLSIEAVGQVIPEKEQGTRAVELVKTIRPDIVVITGHDGMLKDTKDFLDLNNYKNSKYFVEAVNNIRNFEPDYDDLVIFAGACQSCYEKILDAGANFASSPNRVLIHCLDPVFVCEKIAYTNFEKIVSIQEVIENTITGTKGIGGLQTRGKYREGYPKSTYV